ncbi:MAG: hypothetical protein AUG51_05605 [Acidobacteria bacterium 13_1_20CM_3_53_8]|nr:MAG: hypothetical protein AUG51_05605 [Acidobacteria bacterium 13_1_20CM_3_53_8]
MLASARFVRLHHSEVFISSLQAFFLKTVRRCMLFGVALLCLSLCATPLCAQQTNPVDRQVSNPLTDTPNINPLQQDQPQPIRPHTPATTGAQSTEELTVTAERSSGSGPQNARVVVYEGNVDARIGAFRLQADRITVYEATNRIVAEGNVVFDQAPGQRITGSRAEWNYAKKTGFFVNSTGFTNQTLDGTVIYFTADSVEKVSFDTIVATNAEITACEDNVPKWSFRTTRAVIKINDRVRVRSPKFLIKSIPVLWMPYASLSIKPRDRASGFLTPTFGGSGNKGFRLSNAYYQTLGRSADITFRNDIYTSRGLGFGADLRTRANSRSFLDTGFFIMRDRILGHRADADHPDQGGSSFYARGVHYFPNGFLAAADVNITSSLTFRQVFSDTIQQVISPEERSQVFINKNFGDYSFNFLARSQVITIPNTRIRIRQLPSFTLDKRPSALRFFERVPVYFSFEGGMEGVSRKETVDDIAAFNQQVRGLPILTPSVVQRLDIHPVFSVPLNFSGWTVTATAGLRGTYYSNSIDPATRLVLSRDVTRGYGEFELDVRPPALARNFHHTDGSFFFRHVIEPYVIYRKIGGISNFERIIRFDYVDTVANTSEIEYGLVNRFFTRRSTENVSPAAVAQARRSNQTGVPLASQPYEALTITLRGKYFFGGVPRRFSPLNLDVRYRPSRTLFADARTDFDVNRFAVRDIAITFGINRRWIQLFQSFYYSRAITLRGALLRFADARGKEPGTIRGSQWGPSLFLGNTGHGPYGGVTMFFDFQHNPNRTGSSPLISSTVTAGYSFNCCAVNVQYFTFNIGLRDEHRFVFSFRLNGIGTFGTEQIGQALR